MLIGSDPDFAGFTMELPVPNDGVITLFIILFQQYRSLFHIRWSVEITRWYAGYSLWVNADVGTSVADNNSRVDEWSDKSSFGKPAQANEYGSITILSEQPGG